MHEATIASGILDIVVRRLQQYPSTEAISVHVSVGEFRNVDAESLTFAFDSLKENIPDCRDCELIIEPVSLLAVCASGEHQYHPRADKQFRCSCGSGIGTVLQGEELNVTGCTLRAKSEEDPCTK